MARRIGRAVATLAVSALIAGEIFVFQESETWAAIVLATGAAVAAALLFGAGAARP